MSTRTNTRELVTLRSFLDGRLQREWQEPRVVYRLKDGTAKIFFDGSARTLTSVDPPIYEHYSRTIEEVDVLSLIRPQAAMETRRA